jgi:hypothetical protein
MTKSRYRDGIEAVWRRYRVYKKDEIHYTTYLVIITNQCIRSQISDYLFFHPNREPIVLRINGLDEFSLKKY